MRSKDQEKARELRREGHSVKKIAKLLDASTSSVSSWVRNIQLTPSQKDELKERGRIQSAKSCSDNARQRRFDWQTLGRLDARKREFLHVAGCMCFGQRGLNAKIQFYLPIPIPTS